MRSLIYVVDAWMSNGQFNINTSEALREDVYGVVKRLMEDFYAREPAMNVQFGGRKEGMNVRNNWSTVGGPNRGVNGPVRRNEGRMRDSRNKMDREKMF